MSEHPIKRYGIQGDAGSFNEQALQSYFSRMAIDPTTIVVEYLYTTEAVLSSLAAGSIDAGQWAIANSIDGSVERSVIAMAKAGFASHGREIARYVLPIAHSLMIHPAATLAMVTTIISHPTVFRQCANNLRTKFPHLTLQPGAGAWEDPAYVARALKVGDLPTHTATLSSRRIAELHGLQIVAENMQDQSPNLTTFILAEWQRPRSISGSWQ